MSKGRGFALLFFLVAKSCGVCSFSEIRSGFSVDHSRLEVEGFDDAVAGVGSGSEIDFDFDLAFDSEFSEDAFGTDFGWIGALDDLRAVSWTIVDVLLSTGLRSLVDLLLVVELSSWDFGVVCSIEEQFKVSGWCERVPLAIGRPEFEVEVDRITLSGGVKELQVKDRPLI